MKRFRIILTLLALLMMISSAVLVSCDSDGEVTTEVIVTDPEATTEAPEETTAATDDETTEAPETTEPVVTDPPHTHSFGAWNTVKVASCAEEGLSERVCSCGQKETQAIAKTEHKVGEWIIDKEATSTEEGSKHQACTVCGATVKTEIIPVTPHIPGEWIIDKEATCTEDGSKHRVCTKCGETADTEVIPAKGHTEVVDAAVNATCTEDGKTEGKHCSVCSEVLVAQQVIKAAGHKEKVLPAKTATCTEDGKTEGKTCTVCNKTLVEQTVVSAIGHKDGEWITDKAPSYTETGSKHLVCANCGQTIKTETIPMLERVKLEYSLTVLDGTGAPMSGVTVVFTSGGSAVAQITTDNSGKAAVMLEEGEYVAEPDSVDGYYSDFSITLTAAEPSSTVKLVAYAVNPELVYPDEVNGVYSVGLGSVRVPVVVDEMRYFFFLPVEGAVYKIYTDSEKVEAGYYGGSFYVSETNMGEVDENGVVTVEVLHSSVGIVIVIGLKSTSSAVTECTLTIEKASEIEVLPDELPWDQYVPSKTPEKLGDVAGTMTYVQITADITDIFNPSGAISEIAVVYNEKDGYYHLNTADGPILYVNLMFASPFQEALVTIANVTNIGRYFYDEQDNFLGKESYNEAIIAYGNAADSNGVVPLDDDLIYILKNIGENGWYDMLSHNSIFADDEVFVYPYNGWLFACCYFE